MKQRFGGNVSSPSSGSRISRAGNQSAAGDRPEDGGDTFPETLVIIRITRCYIPDDNIHTYISCNRNEAECSHVDAMWVCCESRLKLSTGDGLASGDEPATALPYDTAILRNITYDLEVMGSCEYDKESLWPITCQEFLKELTEY